MTDKPLRFNELPVAPSQLTDLAADVIEVIDRYALHPVGTTGGMAIALAAFAAAQGWEGGQFEKVLTSFRALAVSTFASLCDKRERGS